MPIQYVTLVVQGGTPVRLADQTGAPYPTTGSGALVFANGGVLSNVTITGQVIPTPTSLGRGTVNAPALTFGSTDNGIFSQMAGDVSLATGGNLLVSFQTNVASFAFPVSSTRLNLFSDSAGQTSLQSTDTGGGVHLLTLNKYGGNIAIGNNSAPVAGGSATNGNLLFTSSSVSISTGTGAPTFTAARGSFYLRNDSSFVPYVNSDGGTTWVQILSSGGTLNNPIITGTVTGGASYTAITLTNPTITGTVSGSATYSGVTITSGILVGSALGTPVSGTLTNTTGFPVAQLAGAGSGILTFLAAPSSANLAAAITDETGTGALVFGTAPTLSNPVVGTQSANDNSTKAASTAYVATAVGALKVVVQVFTAASGTYTPTANMLYCTVECWGAGGGGGGTATAGSGIGCGGGGGGAGSYSRVTLSAATIGASKAFVCGAVGTAGTAGNNPGGAGGDTTLGSTLCVGKGGSGGGGNSGTSVAAAGAGGVAGTGDITSTGMPGGTGAGAAASVMPSGAGGSTSVGGGGAGAAVASAAAATGNAGTGHGSGGSGGTSFNAGGTAAGGAGTTGYIVVTEYCSH